MTLFMTLGEISLVPAHLLRRIVISEAKDFISAGKTHRFCSGTFFCCVSISTAQLVLPKAGLIAQLTPRVEPMPAYFWYTVFDADTTLK